MTKGIFMIAFGKRGYMFSAYNFAVSIKHYNPEIPITIFCDDNLEYQLGQRAQIFDEKIKIPENILWRDGIFSPGRIKTSVYNYLPYDYNIILDVDGVALKDINPIFEQLIDKGGYYYAPLLGRHTINQGREIKPMIWAYADTIWEKYLLDDDTVLPCINSSFQFVKKCDEAEDLFIQINKNFDDPIPLSQLKTQWGGNQPDELYIDIALAQKGVDPMLPEHYLFMANSLGAGPNAQISEGHYILSMFGNKDQIRPRWKEYYDSTMIKIFRAKGENHIYKFHMIGADKHANIRPRVTSSNETNLIPAQIPIKDTVELDQSRLLQEYKLPAGQMKRITNWFNCSWIEYKGKRYMAYRLESAPFCKTIQIAMCLIGDDFQPIEGTSKVLTLHSDLRGYVKTYHVEDPRLFIYNDDLYLSYTDGYQMAQAKIDAETLTASESFYLDKTGLQPTEKNWLFFEHEEKLYCLYDIPRHRIFEMNSSQWKEVYKTSFRSEWKYGTIRGGTTPYRIGDLFISFFHSSKDIKYRGMDGKQYYMGAYTFEAKPPFKPVSITARPIIAGEIIDDSISRLSNKIFVVFPSGVIRKGTSWFVSFGYNDYRCRYVEVTDKYLSDEMKPIIYQENLITA